MYVENLKHLLQENIIKFPIKCKVIGKYNAIIIDSRVPENFLRKNYCEICTPHSLLPDYQKKRIQEEIDSGQREEINIGNGMILIKKRFNNSGEPPGIYLWYSFRNNYK